jgi:hypothetical protein
VLSGAGFPARPVTRPTEYIPICKAAPTNRFQEGGFYEMLSAGGECGVDDSPSRMNRSNSARPAVESTPRIAVYRVSRRVLAAGSTSRAGAPRRGHWPRWTQFPLLDVRHQWAT